MIQIRGLLTKIYECDFNGICIRKHFNSTLCTSKFSEILTEHNYFVGGANFLIIYNNNKHVYSIYGLIWYTYIYINMITGNISGYRTLNNRFTVRFDMKIFNEIDTYKCDIKYEYCHSRQKVYYEECHEYVLSHRIISQTTFKQFDRFIDEQNIREMNAVKAYHPQKNIND